MNKDLCREEVGAAIKECLAEFSDATCEIILNLLPFLTILANDSRAHAFAIKPKEVEDGLLIDGKNGIGTRISSTHLGALLSCFGDRNGAMRPNYLYRVKINSRSYAMGFGVTYNRDYEVWRDSEYSADFAGLYHGGCSRQMVNASNRCFTEEFRPQWDDGAVIGFWMGENNMIAYGDNSIWLHVDMKVTQEFQNRELYLVIWGSPHDSYTIMHPIPLKPEELRPKRSHKRSFASLGPYCQFDKSIKNFIRV